MAKARSPIEGQLNIWDIKIIDKPIQITKVPEDIIRPVEIATEIKIISEIKLVLNDKSINHSELTEIHKEFISKNKIMENDNLSRLIKYCGGGLGVEFKYEDSFKTTYVNTSGKEESTFDKKMPVLPMDRILYYKTALVEINNTQEERLQEQITVNPDAKVIRRKGDENIILELEDKVISIIPKGWILEYKDCKAVYGNDEVMTLNPVEEPIDIKTMQQSVKLGDEVEASYGDRTITGTICRVYGHNGITLNIIFDNKKKHTAICRLAVTRILKSA